VDRVTIWGEYNPKEKYFKVGIKVTGWIFDPYLKDFVDMKIWSINALKYYMNQILLYCVQRKIKITKIFELRRID